jgi:ABC-type uncharacterized transport system substrate-binding protein
LKRCALGIFLIAFACGILLLSDLSQRTSKASGIHQVAIFQHVSQPLLDEGVAGILAGLAESGFIDGKNIAVRRFNAENDIATANAIAREITSGQFELVITSSTLSLQAVANANRVGRAKHVFGIVADPASAGVGVSRENPLGHPKHLVGIGTFLPVKPAFELLQRLNPAIKTIGVVWNPGESNSEAFTKRARIVCKELGLTLVEANIENSSGVLEAATSLVSRGVDSLWVGGDVTVMVAIDAVVAAARKGGIPVFSIVPPLVDRGAIFDYGANFFDVGKDTGALAAQVLNGADIAKIPVRNYIPERILINQTALKGLKQQYRFPADVVAKADVVIDETGRHQKSARQPAMQDRPLTRKWNLSLVQLNNVVDVEETEAGVLAGLKESGLVEGRDYELRRQNAQGDMAAVTALIDNAISQGANMIIPFSTPTLQTAIQRARHIPVVFTYIASAIAAGAGRSTTDHLPNVTGVEFTSAYDEMLALIRRLIPDARSVGTIFVPSEVNSVFMKDALVEAARKARMEVVAVPASTSSEVPDAALALAARGTSAICQVPGNLTASAFGSITHAAGRAKLPIFAFQTVQAREGASVVLGRDYAEAGKLTARLAVRIMRGEDPSKIPFETVKRTKLMLNLRAAAGANLKIPADLIQKADEVVH